MIPISSLYQWLSHPLVLLIVGALISSYLIPALTRGWQDHQKELEIKIDLVGQINEAILGIVMATQFAELGAKSQTQEDFDKAYREWEIKAAVIGSRIRVYLPEGIYFDWYAYARVVTDFYALIGTPEEAKRKEILLKFKNYFKSPPIFPVYTKSSVRLSSAMLSIARLLHLPISLHFAHHEINWDADVLAKRDKNHPQYIENWGRLKEQILNHKDDIIFGVLHSHIL